MSTLNGNYKAVIEGRMAKGEFLRQARQMVPQYITALNSYDDAIKILTGKRLLSEELIYQNKADKFPLESIERGIRYELEAMGIMDIHYPSPEQYKKARQRAIDHLCKDPLYYINKIADGYEQPKQEETEGDLEKVTPSKKNLQEARYTEDIREDGAQALHKDVNMNADPGSGVEEPVKKPRATRVQYKDNHDWTTNEYKIAYIIAEFGKDGLKAVFNFFGTPISNASLKLLANNIIGTTDAGLQFAVNGMRKVATSEKGADDWLQSYFNNAKSVEAYQALNGKDLKGCIAELTKETCSEEEAKAAQTAQEQIDRNKEGRQQSIDAATKKIIDNAKLDYKENRTSYQKSFPNDLAKAEKAALISTFKKCGYEKDNPKRAILWSFLRRDIDVSSQTLRDMDSKLGVNDKNVAAFRAKSLATSNDVKTVNEKKALTMRPDEGHGRNHVAPERNREKENPAREAYEQDPNMKVADKLFVTLLSRSNSNSQTFKKQADGSVRRRTPEECLKMVQTKFPAYKKPFKATMRNFGLTWFRKQDGSVHLELKTVHETQSMQENKVDQKEMLLKECIVNLIGKVINEAATTNLAALSDENASVAELPGIINSLENIVTEIESFWIKEQQKIQGVFDQVGNIKNEDGLPVGYKFVQPMLASLKKDLEPVLAKITLDDLKLPEAPAPDQTQVNDPNTEVDPNAVPPVPDKETVFSPAKSKQPLQESKKNKRYTK